jgi:hypothetical protein
MSNTDKQIISIKELSGFNKWLEVLEYSNTTYCNTKEYLELYKAGEKLIKGSIDWSKIFDVLVEKIHFEDWNTLAEVFIRLIESQYKTPIKTGTQITKLTGLTPDNLHNDFIGDVQRLFPNKDYNNTPPEFSLEALLNLCNVFRYEVYLYYLLSVTKDYKELTKIKLSDFNIKENKDKNTGGRFENTQEGFILKSIAFKYNLGEIELGRPPLRDIANLIKAPYSVVLEAYKGLKF